MCLSTENTLHFPHNVGFLWLLVTDPLSTTSFQTLKFRFLIIWSIWSCTDVFNRKIFVCPCFELFLGRTKPRQSEAEQSPVILTCTIPPGPFLKAFRLLIMELDPIERRCLGRRRSANLYWTNLRVLAPRHKLRLHGNARRSWKQFVSHVRIGQNSEHGCVLVEKSFQCWRNHGIKHIELGDNSSPYNQSRCHRFVNWLCYHNFFDPVHCEMNDLLSLNLLQSWSWLSSFVIPQSQEIFQVQFRNRKSRIINHITVRTSSTRILQHSTSTLEVISSLCRILWIVEERRGSSFSSRWSFKNVSWSTRIIPCIVQQSRVVARHGPRNRNGRGLTGNVGRSRTAPWLRIVKILAHLTRKLLGSVKPEFESIIDSQS